MKHYKPKSFLIVLAIPISLFLMSLKSVNENCKRVDKRPVTHDSGSAILLPSSFIKGQRFYIKMPSVKGDTLMGYCDTGGGISMALPATIDKLGLQSSINKAAVKGIVGIHYIPFSSIIKGNRIPAPTPLSNMKLSHHFKKVTEPFFYIPSMDGDMKLFSQTMNFDIFLAQDFFMGHSWTIDYIHRQIWVNTPIPASESNNPGVQKIGLKKDAAGKDLYGHPSMYIQVDGDTIDMLFDTGATIILSESGKKAFNTSDKTIGGSFIASSIFEKWRKNHPDWKVYEKADLHADVIEVPKVKIGGYEVGPVLFAERADENWSKGMISSMDKVVKGAIGGSGLQYLKVNIDYNSELIKFEK